MQNQKRVAAIHDISGFGRCSLTVALPIISAAGIECTVMPTAILSTHTGGFTGYTFRDLTDDLTPMAQHWRNLGLTFDGIHTGYLGSGRQIQIVQDFFADFRRPGTVALVDPAMADNGVMYPAFDREFARQMAGLCAQADVIVPNMTEAAFMLDREYVEGPYTEAYVSQLLHALADMGRGSVVLTGIALDDKLLGAACLERESGKISYAFSQRVEGYYHGTGDVYASVLIAALLRDQPLSRAIQIAVDFTQAAIVRTRLAGTDVRFGVNFEAGLGRLAETLSSEA